MPNRSENLSQFFCGSSGKGIICGNCETGYSAHYHSMYSNYCGENKQGEYGLLFYFLSEIVPVGIFFSIVVIFGIISFSSGSLNLFVFFSQVVDIFSKDLTLFEVYKVNPIVRALKSGHHLIIRNSKL